MSVLPIPFTVNFSVEALHQLKAQLKGSHVAKPTYEASKASVGKFGMKHEWLVEAKARWEDGFDW